MQKRYDKVKALVAQPTFLLFFFLSGAPARSGEKPPFSRETPIVHAVRKGDPAVVNLSTVSAVDPCSNPFSSFGQEYRIQLKNEETCIGYV